MRISTVLTCVCLLVAVGCSPVKPPAAQPVSHGHDHGHSHGHNHGPHPDTGPHNGHLVELGDEAYHLEWTHDDEANEVTVYVLDGAAKELVPITSEAISIFSVVEDENAGDQSQEFKLPAVNPSGEPPMSAQFSLQDAALLMSLKMVGQGSEVTVPVTIDGQEYTGKFEEHDHAGHGHSH